MTKKAPNTATPCLVIVGVEGIVTVDDAAFHRASRPPSVEPCEGVPLQQFISGHCLSVCLSLSVVVVVEMMDNVEMISSSADIEPTLS